ncbi:hypothetical protein MBLNU230_g3176t1 [Neophaeotheca triangularis]
MSTTTTTTTTATPPPALLTAVDSTSHIHLIVGSNPLAGARCNKSIQVGAKPILIAPEDATVHYGLAKRIEEGKVQWIKEVFNDDHVRTLGREEIDGYVDAVFVTSGSSSQTTAHISSLCRRLRIPINVADAPNLCTFTLLSTHTSGPLQVGVTTSGKGCKLASRIRREIASALPQDLGHAIERLGTVRRRIWEEDHAAELSMEGLEAEDDESGQTAAFNKLITPTDAEAAKARRMRWLAQICEYWPLRRLAAITDADVDTILASYKSDTSTTTTSDSKPPLTPSTLDTRHHPQRGHMILAGSGPGHPDLLTTATHKAILRADLILADKLVPSGVLDLIPRRTPLHIARKFPGNAEAAQQELLSLGLSALQKGQTVLRLKQGDPYLYGRGAEEYAFFHTQHAYSITVLPGLTSAFTAPLFAQIPLTHRAVSDQVLVCTGTGRKGASPAPPPYLPNQTVVFLMSLHRLSDLITSLTVPTSFTTTPPTVLDEKSLYPATTPCAVIERASCPDQRVIRSSLQDIAAAIEEEGSRPPGLLVVGAACEVVAQCGRGRKWVVEEGCEGLGWLEREEGGMGLEGLKRQLETPGLAGMERDPMERVGKGVGAVAVDG